MSKLRYAAICASAVCTLTVGLLVPLEGKSNKAYLDLVQVPTICYGTTRNVKLGDYKTDTECMTLLVDEINRLDAIIDRTVKVKLKDHERAAILSWMYNVGETKFYSSTLLRKLNQGDKAGACKELHKWVYAKGKRLKGLENRRATEYAMCIGDTK